MKNKYLLVIVFSLLSTILFAQEDTIINVPVTIKIPFRIKKEIIRDTIIIVDSVYVGCLCPPDSTIPTIPDTLKFSQFGGTFKEFIKFAGEQNKIAVLDSNISITEPIGVRGNSRLIGYNKPTIISNQRWVFWLYEGDHLFDNLNIIMTNPLGYAFYTDAKNNIIWNNVIKNTDVTGGESSYVSSLGGNDSTKCGTIIENCNFENSTINVRIFSQDGPYKYLHLCNTELKTTISHNLYLHPNVSYKACNTSHLGAGKLALHHFSRDGVPGIAEYITVTGAKSFDNYSPFQFPPNQIARIDSSDIALYSDGNQVVWATNTNFKQVGGAGAWVTGESIIDNCTGYILTSGASISNSNLKQLRLQSSGITEIVNSTVEYCGGGGLNNEFHLILDNTHILGMSLTNINPFSTILLLNGSTITPAYNWKIPPGLIIEP